MHALKFFLLSTTLWLGALSNMALAMQWDPAINKGVLDNGLKYYFYNSEKAEDGFNIQLMVHAGAIDEQENQLGVAHMLEHMVFHATQQHPRSIFSYLDDIGWSTGKEINAITTATETRYMIRGAANDALDIEQSLALLADMMWGAQLKPIDWKIERKIILEEWRRGSGVTARINAQKKAIIRNGSAYVGRAPIGNANSIKTMPLAELQKFYKKWYVPANMSLVISGKLDMENTLAMLNEKFGAASVVPQAKRTSRALPLKKQLHIAKIQDPQGSVERTVYGLRFDMKAGIHKPAMPYYELQMQSYLLARLIPKSFQKQLGMFEENTTDYSAILDNTTPTQFTLAFSAQGTASHGALKTIFSAIERLKSQGLDEQAFNALKAKMNNISKRNMDAVKHRNHAQWAEKITNAVLSGKPLSSPEQQHQQLASYLDSITLQQLNMRLKKWLQANDEFIYYQAEAANLISLPTKKMVHSWKMQAKHTPPPRKQALQSADELAQKIATDLPNGKRLHVVGGGIVNYHFAPKEGVHTWQLINGDRVIWLDRENNNKTLLIRAIAKSGYSNNLYSPWKSQVALQLTEQSGLKVRENTQGENASISKKLAWRWHQDEYYLNLSNQLTPATLEQGFRLYHHLHLSHWIEPDSLAQVKPTLRQRKSAPHKTANQVITNIKKSVFNGLHLQPGIKEIDDLTLEQLRSAANSHLKAPADIFISGHMDKSQLEKIILDNVANIPRDTALKTVFRPYPSIGKVDMAIEIFNSVGEEKGTVHSNEFSDSQWSAKKELMLAMLNPLLKKALKQRLRRELGATYSVDFKLSYSASTRQLTSRLHFLTDPFAISQTAAQANKIFEVAGKNIDAQEYEKLHKALVRQETQQLAYDVTWLQRLILSQRLYNDSRYLTTMLSAADAITLNTLKEFLDEIYPMDNSLNIHVKNIEEKVAFQ